MNNLKNRALYLIGLLIVGISSQFNSKLIAQHSLQNSDNFSFSFQQLKTCTIAGKIKTYPTQQKVKILFFNAAGDTVLTDSTRSDGFYSVTLSIETEEKYSLLFDSDSCMPVYKMNIQRGLLTKGKTIINDTLRRIGKNKALRLNNISFSPGSSVLDTLQIESLFSLLYIMKKYPKMTIALDGYVNGEPSQNTAGAQKLSFDRAESVSLFLISRGITSNRIVVKGFGTSKPLAGPNIKGGQQLNMRVEVRILTY